MWSEAERFPVIVTPSIFNDVSDDVMSGSGDGGSTFYFFLTSLNITSLVFICWGTDCFFSPIAPRCQFLCHTCACASCLDMCHLQIVLAYCLVRLLCGLELWPWTLLVWFLSFQRYWIWFSSQFLGHLYIFFHFFHFIPAFVCIVYRHLTDKLYHSL